MNNFIIFSLLISFVLTGCATKEVQISKAKVAPSNQILAPLTLATSNKAKVTFIRDSGFIASGVFQHIFIDEKEVAKLNPSEKISFDVKIGEHIFSVIPTDPFGKAAKSTIVVNLKKDKKYYYRIVTDGNTFRTFIQRTIYHP